jgi:hypothetical protein
MHFHFAFIRYRTHLKSVKEGIIGRVKDLYQNPFFKSVVFLSQEALSNNYKE